VHTHGPTRVAPIKHSRPQVICLGTEDEPGVTKVNVNLQLRIWIGQLTRARICCSDALVVDPTRFLKSFQVPLPRITQRPT